MKVTAWHAKAQIHLSNMVAEISKAPKEEPCMQREVQSALTHNVNKHT